MIISKSKNFVFIHIEKTGGTSIEHALTPHIAWDDIFFGGEGNHHEIMLLKYKEYGLDFLKKHGLWKHSTAEQVKKYLGDEWNNMYKFAVVRNPFDRAVSAYNFRYYFNMWDLKEQNINNIKYVILDECQTDDMIQVGNTLKVKDKDKEIFYSTLIDGSGINGFIPKAIENNIDAYIPQYDQLDDSLELFDTNKLIQDWENIFKKINIKDSVPFVHTNKTLYKPKKIVLNNETIKIINNHFYNDFEIVQNRAGSDWDESKYV